MDKDSDFVGKISQALLDDGLIWWAIATLLFGIILGLICTIGVMSNLRKGAYVRSVIWVGFPYGGAGGINAFGPNGLLSIIPPPMFPLFLIVYSLFLIVPLAIEYRRKIVDFVRRQPAEIEREIDPGKFTRRSSEENINEI